MRRFPHVLPLLLAAALLPWPALAARPASPSAPAASPTITILYDAFGDDPAMEKDWGFAALVEAGGKRILFDTGNDAEVFRRNLAAKGVDLGKLDFVVMSHRHSDHMAGIPTLLAANPDVTIYAPQEGFGLYGASLPSTFYRKDDTLPARMRYYDGQPPETLVFGTAWPEAKLKPLAATTEIAPGVHAIALVSDAPGTRELRELSLAIETPQGLVLVVGCSHPGIAAIVAEAAKLDPDIHLVLGGLHFVAADDAAIASMTGALQAAKVEFIAPGHCTGEPTFAALQRAFGDRYVYAGVGAVLTFDTANGPARPRGTAALLSGEARDAYRALAARGHHDHDHPHDHALATVASSRD